MLFPLMKGAVIFKCPGIEIAFRHGSLNSDDPVHVTSDPRDGQRLIHLTSATPKFLRITVILRCSLKNMLGFKLTRSIQTCLPALPSLCHNNNFIELISLGNKSSWAYSSYAFG